MNYDRRQLDDIARYLKAEGYFFYRHDFVWGVTPSFRNVRGTRFYFIADGDVLTPQQMYAHLVETWRPVAYDERMFFQNRLAAHFAVLPRDVPEWSGLSPEQMISIDVFSPTRVMTTQRDDAYAV
jgi:hypothetical protein